MLLAPFIVDAVYVLVLFVMLLDVGADINGVVVCITGFHSCPLFRTLCRRVHVRRVHAASAVPRHGDTRIPFAQELLGASRPCHSLLADDRSVTRVSVCAS